MDSTEQQAHDARVVDQFTRQAIPFTELPQHLDAVRMLVQLSGVESRDHVLDVACGPGMVACAFARTARHVTGIDLTEGMIEQARNQQREQGLQNLTWRVGTATALPFEAGSFSVVVTRYSFHHFLDPQAVLQEMIRVCRPGGVVLVADVELPADKVDAYDRLERLRDPSHTRALSDTEWAGLLAGSGLQDLQRGSYRVPMELESQLKASFPNPGDEERVRQMLTDDVGVNALGMDARAEGGSIHFSYPISVYVGSKPLVD